MAAENSAVRAMIFCSRAVPTARLSSSPPLFSTAGFYNSVGIFQFSPTNMCGLLPIRATFDPH